MLLSQFKNPILLKVDDSSWTSISAAQTAINNVLSGNAGYCLAGVVETGDQYYVFDEDWGVENPIHSVLLVDITGPTIEGNVSDALSNNPGHRLVELRSFAGVPANVIVLGST